jgi:hypothetical protein
MKVAPGAPASSVPQIFGFSRELSSARDNPLSVDIVEPCDTGLHAAAGITEEHRVYVQRNRIVRTTSGKRAIDTVTVILPASSDRSVSMASWC